MNTADRLATIVFRIIVGIIGLTVLVVVLKFKLYEKELTAFSAIGGFCGLLLGYAFGGDKWGARLFTLFTGHHVPTKRSEDEEPLANRSGNDVT